MAAFSKAWARPLLVTAAWVCSVFVWCAVGAAQDVGSIVALSGLAAAIVAKGGLESRFAVGAAAQAQGYGWPLAMLTALAVGTMAGLAQGLAVTRLKVPPFVVTLGTLSIARSLAMVLSDNRMIFEFGPDQSLLFLLGGDSTWGIAHPVIALVTEWTTSQGAIERRSVSESSACSRAGSAARSPVWRRGAIMTCALA